MKNIIIIHKAPAITPAMTSGENEYGDETSYCKYPTLNLRFLPTRTYKGKHKIYFNMYYLELLMK